MKKLFVIVKTPQDPVGVIKEIDNSLQALQELVGGHIQAVPVAENMYVICDDDGRNKGYENNCDVCGINFVGTIAAVGIKGDEFADCPVSLDEWAEKYLRNGG